MHPNTSTVLLSVSLLSALVGYFMGLRSFSSSSASTHVSTSFKVEVLTGKAVAESLGSEGGKRMLAVTRIHVAEAIALTSVDKVTSFVRNALQYSAEVLICVSSLFSP